MSTPLQSPGIQVNVIDESFYTPAAAGTVPMLFVATGQDKQNASGTGIAQGTTAANAGKVWVITSQRDLTDTFGTPYFETDAEGNPVHGGEVNEYGLQAAYSALGVSSKAYVVRADVDLSSLDPQSNAPTGLPKVGTYWVDTANSLFGIFEWNAATGKFTEKTPLIIDNSNKATWISGGIISPSFGKVGDYAMVITSDNANQLYYKTADATPWAFVNNTFPDGNIDKQCVIAPHTQYPNFTAVGTGALSAPTGSVWIKTTTPGNGANWKVKYWQGATQAWTTVPVSLYSSITAAIASLDPVAGGAGIPLGTVIVEYDYTNQLEAAQGVNADFKLWIRYSNAPTTITAPTSSTVKLNSASAFSIRESLANGTWGSEVQISLPGSPTNYLGYEIASRINVRSDLFNIKATWDDVNLKLSISHTLGGDFELKQTTGTPLTQAGFTINGTTANLYTAPSGDNYSFGIASNWKPLVYEALSTAPVTNPADGTLWYNNVFEADIMYHNGTKWVGYKSALSPFQNTTDVKGPIVSATMPQKQSDGVTSLAVGDIWIDTSMPDMYGQNIYVFDGSKWALQDVTDHTTPNGWVFHDARQGLTGGTATVAPAGTIAALLSSDYVDPDCPDPALYPRGTRLFNTRRSGNNVKYYDVGYINTNSTNPRYNNESMSTYYPNRWVTASPNDVNGVGAFGRLSQRGVVVKALDAMIASNQSIRDTDTLNFNLIACPGYPEAIQPMVTFNTDIGQTAFILGDTPFRLEPNGTTLTTYGSNSMKAVDNNDQAAVTFDTHLAMFYPSGYTNDNRGNKIVVPPSHMMLRTIINSDAKSYLWFAPAGTRRGTIDNASSVGYVNDTGEFKTVSLYQGLRDVLSSPTVRINPIATLPGVGLVNMGQYTRTSIASSLDRINVSRLVSYLRRQLGILAKPYLFEPNDAQTRKEIKSAAETLMLELVGQRALYDFLVVCDTSNNTPARIDRSELYLDIAIEPVKAVEFIYIPLRLLNTGAIKSGNLGSMGK